MGSLGWRASALVIECCRVALSNIRGDRVSRMVVQSSFRICRHFGAMERSHSGLVAMLRLSFAKWTGFVEAKSARKYVRPLVMFAERVFAWWGWPIAIPCHRGSMGGHPGRALEFLPIQGRNIPRVVLIVGEFWLVGGKVAPPRCSRLHPS